MLSSQVKKEISDKVQKILQGVVDDELPGGEINFILHVDGEEGWSWANIQNDSKKHVPAPNSIQRNLSI